MDHQTIGGLFALLARVVRREARCCALWARRNGAYDARTPRKKLNWVPCCVVGQAPVYKRTPVVHLLVLTVSCTT
jgi:hypothetical protein